MPSPRLATGLLSQPPVVLLGVPTVRHDAAVNALPNSVPGNNSGMSTLGQDVRTQLPTARVSPSQHEAYQLAGSPSSAPGSPATAPGSPLAGPAAAPSISGLGNALYRAKDRLD